MSEHLSDQDPANQIYWFHGGTIVDDLFLLFWVRKADKMTRRVIIVLCKATRQDVLFIFCTFSQLQDVTDALSHRSGIQTNVISRKKSMNANIDLLSGRNTRTLDGVFHKFKIRALKRSKMWHERGCIFRIFSLFQQLKISSGYTFTEKAATYKLEPGSYIICQRLYVDILSVYSVHFCYRRRYFGYFIPACVCSECWAVSFSFLRISSKPSVSTVIAESRQHNSCSTPTFINLTHVSALKGLCQTDS